jgi:GT2 family glycosyltransferase
MRRAFGEAIAADYDYYLWMNDDTELDDGVVELLLSTERGLREQGHGPVIVAGTNQAPLTPESLLTVARSGSRAGGVWHGRSCSPAANRALARR